MADDPSSLRATFESVAHLYDGRRPPVPAGLYDAIVSMSGLDAGGRVLEVGCGTGRATVPMAARGYRITGIELGPHLADVARRNLAPYEDVDIQTGEFEMWEWRGEPFDLLMSLDAWHWLDPAVRTAKTADLLRDGGGAAIVFGTHVAGGDTEFFDDTQVFYELYMPGTPPNLRLTEPDDVAANDWGFSSSEDFDPPVFRRWVTEAEYTTATYLELIETFSSHIALPSHDRRALFAGIAELLDARYGGRIRRATLTELCVARRRPRRSADQPPGGV